MVTTLTNLTALIDLSALAFSPAANCWPAQMSDRLSCGKRPRGKWWPICRAC
jgi:hypothetical protein